MKEGQKGGKEGTYTSLTWMMRSLVAATVRSVLRVVAIDGGGGASGGSTAFPPPSCWVWHCFAQTFIFFAGGSPSLMLQI